MSIYKYRATDVFMYIYICFRYIYIYRIHRDIGPRGFKYTFLQVGMDVNM